jgi:catechol 2,3-dioxygenase
MATSTSTELATFGPVHLEVVDRERSLHLWRDLVGLEVLDDGEGVELGAADEALVVLHPVAERPVLRGYSGLYHLAIHLPDEAEFARVLARLIARRYPIAPTDHVMSKAIYLNDPDGIGLELTLETPERIRKWDITDRGPEVIDAEGRRRDGTEPLDVGEVLATLPDRDLERPLPAGTKVGHVHLHVGDLEAAYRFYRDELGFIEHVYAPRFGFADLHAGGRFPHRMAVNVWQGDGAPRPPQGTAGMRHFTIRFDSAERLEEVTGRVAEPEPREDGHVVRDPAGNVVLLRGSAAG